MVVLIAREKLYLTGEHEGRLPCNFCLDESLLVRLNSQPLFAWECVKQKLFLCCFC